jgi:hypothetical protein
MADKRTCSDTEQYRLGSACENIETFGDKFFSVNAWWNWWSPPTTEKTFFVGFKTTEWGDPTDADSGAPDSAVENTTDGHPTNPETNTTTTQGEGDSLSESILSLILIQCKILRSNSGN